MKRAIVISSLLFLLLTLAVADAAPARRGHMGVGMMYDEPVYYSAVLTGDASKARPRPAGRQLDGKYPGG